MLDIFHHDDCLKHDMGLSHPECADRISAITKLLRQSELPLRWHTANRIDKNFLLKTHSKDYIDSVFALNVDNGYHVLGADVVMNNHSLNAACYAAGSVIDAVDSVCQNLSKTVFCAVRPPGHHAEYQTPMGFCFFNNIAAGVIHAKDHYQLQRIAIVDFDVHHGNGTEDIFKNTPEVLFCSSFQHPFYPGTQLIENHPSIVHLPLTAGTSGDDYRTQFNEVITPRLIDFKPELIFVSAGYDAHQLDPLGELNLIEDDYYWLGQTLKALANRLCDGNIISVLEGGYHLTALSHSVYAYLKGLIE